MPQQTTPLPLYSLDDYMSLGYTETQLKMIKSKMPEGLTNAALFEFLYTASQNNLDPMGGEITLVRKKDNYSPHITIDGLRKIATETGRYSPGPKTEWKYAEDGTLISATAFVMYYHTESLTWHTVPAEAFYVEYVQLYLDKSSNKMLPTSTWAKMPHVMLEKCAEAKALRKAFPRLAKLYIPEEGDAAPGLGEPPSAPVAPSASEQLISSVKEKLERS